MDMIPPTNRAAGPRATTSARSQPSPNAGAPPSARASISSRSINTKNSRSSASRRWRIARRFSSLFARSLHPRVTPIHVGEDQPPPLFLEQCQRELPTVWRPLLLRVGANDVAQRVVHAECDGSQRQGAARPRITLLNGRTALHRRAPVGNDDPIVGEEPRERRGVTARPRGFVVGQHARELGR